MGWMFPGGAGLWEAGLEKGLAIHSAKQVRRKTQSSYTGECRRGGEVRLPLVLAPLLSLKRTLGVCMGRIGRSEEGRRHEKAALGSENTYWGNHTQSETLHRREARHRDTE